MMIVDEKMSNPNTTVVYWYLLSQSTKKKRKCKRTAIKLHQQLAENYNVKYNPDIYNATHGVGFNSFVTHYNAL